MRRAILAIGIMATVTISAISLAVAGNDDAANEPEPNPDRPPTQADPDPAAGVDWADDGHVVSFDGGWSVRACEGEGPFLCVLRDGRVVGPVEASSMPLDSLPELADVVATGDDEAILAAFASRFLDHVQEDREIGCGDGYRVVGHDVRPAQVGGDPGIRYGFTGGTGTDVSERVTAYATIQDDLLVLIVAAAYDADGCLGDGEGGAFATDDLIPFEPLLERIVTWAPLPAAVLGLTADTIGDGVVVATDGGLDGGRLWFLWAGGRQRIYQPRAMTDADLAELGITVGPRVERHLTVAGEAGYSSFAVYPADGPDAQLYVLIGDLLHRVPVIDVDHSAIEDLPELDDLILDRAAIPSSGNAG